MIQAIDTDIRVGLPDRALDPVARQKPARILELDGLRALACGLVLVHHFAGSWVRGFPVGVIGVRVFFVLSGYLITGILLEQRRCVETDGDVLLPGILRFYGRRMRRLLPVLYLAVGMMTLLNLGIARMSWAWDLTYTSNFYAMKIQMLGGAVGHLWTLAIEEQFYLVWPWVILLSPRRMVGKIIIGTVVAAPVFRTIGWLAGWHWTVIYCMPIGACDALGLGALLVYCEREKLDWQPTVQRFRKAALAIGVPLATGGLLLMPLTLNQISRNQTWHWAVRPVQYYRQAVTDSALALLGFGLLGMILQHRARWFNGILRNRVLVYLGTISYGTYVYHVPLKEFYEQRLLSRFSGLPGEGSMGYFILLSFMSIALAVLSWHLIEKPIKKNSTAREYARDAEARRS